MSSSPSEPTLAVEDDEDLADMFDDHLTKSEGRVAMFKLAQAVGADSVGPDTGMVEAASAVAAEFESLADRVAELEQNMDAISDLGRERTSKEEKIAAIIQFAMNKADGSRSAVLMRPNEIKGIAGVSERYAYNLVDDLPEEYEFFRSRDEARQYGSLGIDTDKQAKAMIVDVELLQQNEAALNKFNNGRPGQGDR